MKRKAVCPECGSEFDLYYSKRDVTILEGSLVAVLRLRSGPFTDSTPDLNVAASQTEQYERVDCNACGAGWPTWEDFLACFESEDHENECVIR